MKGPVRIVRTFLDADEGSNLAAKGAKLAAGAAVYDYLDWFLAGVTASLLAILHHYGFKFLSIFILLWTGNILLSGLVVICSGRLGIDFTLSEGCRRLVDLIAEKSKAIALLLECGLIIYIGLWWGAGALHIFLRNRFGNKAVKLVIFGLVSGIQMAACTGLFAWAQSALWSLSSSIFVFYKGISI